MKRVETMLMLCMAAILVLIFYSHCIINRVQDVELILQSWGHTRSCDE